jgi:hypothetical protein
MSAVLDTSTLAAVSELQSSPNALKAKLASIIESAVQSSIKCSDHLRHAPSLADVVRDRFESQLSNSIGIANSDILFVHGHNVDEALTGSMSLTRVFIHSMLNGQSNLAARGIPIYNRRDSFDPRDGIADEDIARIWSAFDRQLELSVNGYMGELAAFWSTAVPASGTLKSSRLQLFSDHQRQLLKDEITVHELSGTLQTIDKQRLLQVSDSASPEGVFSVALQLPGQAAMPIASTFIIASDPAAQNLLDSSGVCYLITPAQGVSRFESLTQLTQHLVSLLTIPASEAGLVSMLSLYAQDVLAALPSSISLQMLRFEPQSAALFLSGGRALEHKQGHDFWYLVERTRQNGGTADTFIQAWAPHQTLAHVDEAARHRVQRLTKKADALVRPHWFRYGDDAQKQRLLQLEAATLARHQALDELLEPMASIGFYAHHKMAGYMRDYLGCVVDPAKIHVKWTCQPPANSMADPVPRSKTLLALAVDGMPAGITDAVVTLPRSARNPALDFAFIAQMLAELDVRRSYELDWASLHRSAGVERATVNLRDSALDLCVASAVMQGRLSARGRSVIQALKTKEQKSGSTFSINGIALMSGQNRFRDAILFCEERPNDDHYVLYAPGAPGGSDVMEFNTWRQLSFSIGGWLQTPEGARYVQEQVCTQLDQHTASFLQMIQALPSRWSPETILIDRLDARDYEHAMALLVRARSQRQLQERALAVSSGHLDGSYHDRQTIIALRDQIEALNAQYLNMTDVVSYREFARERGSRMVNHMLRAKGIDGQVDTDKVFIDPDISIKSNDPDFTFASHLAPLTELFMKGFYEGIFSPYPAPLLVSSDWKTSRALSEEIIAMAGQTRFGQLYIEQTEKELADASHPQYPARRALFAARKQCEMLRDALLAKGRNELDQAQYEWVRAVVLSLSGSGDAEGGQAARLPSSSVNVLHINDRLIDGALVLRDFSTEDPAFSLAYTPDAPDGQAYRRTAGFVASLQVAGMAEYYFQRAAFRDQRVIGSLLASHQQPNSDDRLEASIRIVPEYRVTHFGDFYDGMIQRIIDDVDEQSESVTETAARYLYTIIKWVGTIALMPFPGASLAWGILHSSIDLARGVLAYRDGDRATASVFFLSAWLGAFSAGKGTLEIIKGSGFGLQAAMWFARRPVFWKNFHVLM